jgi:hypothetical protein
VLQPNLFTRTTLVSPETKIINMWQAALPGFATLTKAMYQDAVSARPDRTYEFSHVFDAEPKPLFIDNVHVNETGNRLVAVALASTLFAGQARQ